MVYDFHVHSLLSDGASIPIEMIRMSMRMGYAAIAITDHVGPSNIERVIREVIEDCKAASTSWGIVAVPGVEISNVPKDMVKCLAKKAKELGARLVVVHGESPIENVEPGTNYEAVTSPDVDILAHPGLITREELAIARENGVFIELSARKGHSMANGHVARWGTAEGVNFLVNSDAHQEDDLLTFEKQVKVIRCAGIGEKEVDKILRENPMLLLKKIGYPSGVKRFLA